MWIYLLIKPAYYRLLNKSVNIHHLSKKLREWVKLYDIAYAQSRTKIQDLIKHNSFIQSFVK